MTENSPLYPWLASYPENVDWSAPIPPAPLYALFDEAVQNYPNNICIECMDRKYTYKEIGTMVAKMAKGLKEKGIGKGTRIGLFLPNCPYFVVSYYAILKIGGIVVNYNPLYSMRELQQQIDDSNTQIMITLNLQQFYYKMMTLLHSTRLNTLIVAHIEDLLPTSKRFFLKLKPNDSIVPVAHDLKKVAFNDLLDNDGVMKPVPLNPETDCAVLQYTGGTTGIPKAAMLTHANLYSNVIQSSRWFTMLEPGKETMMGALPLFHVFAMTVVMNLGIYKGARLLLHPRFDVRVMLKDIHQKKVTLLPGVPTMFVAISNLLQSQTEHKLSSVKLCISGGAPLPKEVHDLFEEVSGCRLVEGYGLTESSPVVAVNPPDERNRAGSVGLPLPQTVVEIRDVETHDHLNQGEIGEICVRGPQVMQGYMDQEEETNNVLKDRRLHTGDVGYMDNEGYVYVVDRLKELIIAGGFKIYPRHVEEALYMHPDIAEAAVIGIPDAYRGQTVKAYIVCKKEKTLTADILKMFLQGKLAPFEVPTEFQFLSELPKTLVGKILKRELEKT